MTHGDDTMIQHITPRYRARTMPRRRVLRLGAAALAAPLAASQFSPASAAHDVGPGYAYLPVPTYVQQRPLSCEYASAVIAMANSGAWHSEWAFDEAVPLSPNPHWGYRGNINGAWGGTDDYGVYASPLIAPLASFGFWSQPFYGAGDTTQLKALLTEGMPVLVWLGLFGDVSFHEYVHDTRYRLVPGMHVVVARGFDDAGVSVSDPANGAYKFFPWADFMWAWNVLDGMALGVGPVG
jgi:uncharacterized protein YvpB